MNLSCPFGIVMPLFSMLFHIGTVIERTMHVLKLRQLNTKASWNALWEIMISPHIPQPTFNHEGGIAGPLRILIVIEVVVEFMISMMNSIPSEGNYAT